MPVLKAVNGHTRCANVMRYLTRKDRALACDYLNIDAPVTGYEDGLPAYGDVDWAAVMDSTRHRYGNDEPWRGKRVRTYKHYIISPDPRDAIALPALRELATTWTAEHFPDHEVAIVYHDDNAGGIPHAHLVVNNTNLETGGRLQVPDPKSLNRSLQRLAEGRGLSAFDNVERAGTGSRPEREADGPPKRRPPRTLQRVHRSRAEAELSDAGRYSWVADIRARVDVARCTATCEAEFRSTLAQMGVEVYDNSPKARRPDWLYALADKPTRRVSGEKLGLLYSKESLQRRFAYAPSRMAEADRDAVAGIARDAIEIGDLDGLRRLASAVALVDKLKVRSAGELERAVERGEADPRDPAVREALEAGFLPDRAARPRAAGREAPSAAGPDARRETSWRQQAGGARQASRPQRPEPRSGHGDGRGR